MTMLSKAECERLQHNTDTLHILEPRPGHDHPMTRVRDLLDTIAELRGYLGWALDNMQVLGAAVPPSDLGKPCRWCERERYHSPHLPCCPYAAARKALE